MGPLEKQTNPYRNGASFVKTSQKIDIEYFLFRVSVQRRIAARVFALSETDEKIDHHADEGHQGNDKSPQGFHLNGSEIFAGDIQYGYTGQKKNTTPVRTTNMPVLMMDQPFNLSAMSRMVFT
jgi:hypothetical protein